MVAGLCNAMIGNKLITKQTPPEGIPVSQVIICDGSSVRKLCKNLESIINASCHVIINLKVMVAEAIDITRETYFCIAMDRDSNGPVIVARQDKCKTLCRSDLLF